MLSMRCLNACGGDELTGDAIRLAHFVVFDGLQIFGVLARRVGPSKRLYASATGPPRKIALSASSADA